MILLNFYIRPCTMTIPLAKRNSIFGAIRNAQYTCWVSVDYDFAHLTILHAPRIVRTPGKRERTLITTKHTRLARKLGCASTLITTRRSTTRSQLARATKSAAYSFKTRQLAEASFVWQFDSRRRSVRTEIRIIWKIGRLISIVAVCKYEVCKFYTRLNKINQSRLGLLPIRANKLCSHR